MLVKINDVPDTDLIKFYNAATLAIFPSLCEGFGIPPIESGVLETSTICSNSTAMKDFTFFKDRFFDAESKESIKRTITKFLNTKDDSNQKDELFNIAKSIEETYNWCQNSSKVKIFNFK